MNTGPEFKEVREDEFLKYLQAGLTIAKELRSGDVIVRRACKMLKTEICVVATDCDFKSVRSLVVFSTAVPRFPTTSA